MLIPCVLHGAPCYSIHIPCILHSYSMHMPYIFQASAPGTVFHVIPSAPRSPRANSLPLPHGAFACTSRVVTCSDLGQDVAEASSYTQLCRADVAEPCVYTVL